MFRKKPNVQQQLQSELAQLYDQYIDKVYRFIFFKTSNTHIAEDLTSEVFLKIWQALIKQRKLKSKNAFIYTVARNVVIDYYRRKQTSIDIEDINERIYSVQIDTYIASVHTNIEMRPIYKALGKLKEEYREVVLLRYIEELSIAEISSILGKKRGTVRVLLHRALQQLREALPNKSENQITSL